MSSSSPLSLHPGLFSSTRLRDLASDGASASARDWVILIAAGVGAACISVLLDFHLRVPGHAILRSVFPMAIGLALVPRRGAGCVMGAAAAITIGAFRMSGATGEGMSLGATTSLIATGPILDWTLRHASGGWRLYASFAAAGLASNLLALTVRGGAKAFGWERIGSRPLSAWLPYASMTYVICGVLAGLISAGIWFYASRDGQSSSEEAR